MTSERLPSEPRDSLSDLTSGVDAKADAPSPTVPARSPAQTLSRLTKIEIQNYRGVRGTLELEFPKQQNLLVYGENGSGKSSLYHALRDFLEAPDISVKAEDDRERKLTITDYRHRFTNQPPSVTLVFGSEAFLWSDTTNDTARDLVRLANQSKGFLDYRALLEVHHVRTSDTSAIDLFPLLIGRLLPYYRYPSRGKSLTLQEGWATLNSLVERKWSGQNRRDDFIADLEAFNDALLRTVHDLDDRASAMMTKFGEEIRLGFHFTKAELKEKPKRIARPRVVVRPAFRRQEFPDYYNFFNEARLGALAICLFFAALKDSPSVGIRLLALDDVLIGLDMSNRLHVLDLVNEHFSEWQIFLLTYSKAWFEILKERVAASKWAAPWQSIVLREEWIADENSPRTVAEGSGDLLEMAIRHLARKDYAAAAVYGRCALEALCHRMCAKAHLRVMHVDSLKGRKLEHYLEALEPRLGQISDEQRRTKSFRLVTRLKQARASVLNRKAHFDPEEEETLSVDVGKAIDTVRELEQFLEEQDWNPQNFTDSAVVAPAGRLALRLAEATALAKANHRAMALKELKCAHDLAWEIYGTRAKVQLPIGQPLSAKSIWQAALDQGKLVAEMDTRLKAARPYLFDSVASASFDLVAFEAAAALLGELARSDP